MNEKSSEPNTYKKELLEEIKKESKLNDPQLVKEACELLEQEGSETLKAIKKTVSRRSQALASFQGFLDSYFSHYFTIPSGPQQLELIELIESLKGRPARKPLKYSRAVSRGFGKSTIVSLCGALWLMLRGEWKFVLLISASLSHSENFLRKISDEIEANELLIEDFRELEPARDSNGTTVAWNDRHLVFTGGFAVIAKGFGNKIRGLRYKNYRPDAVLIDDPDEYSDVESQSTMRRRYRWLERSVLNTGSVLSGLDVVIVYTTIAENCIGEYIYLNRENKFSHFNRKKYKALEVLPPDGEERSSWEAGAPTALLLEEKAKDPLGFASERQNEPLPEAGQCFKGLIQTYSFERPSNFEGWRLALGVDESLGRSERSNPSAIIGVGMSPEGIIYELYSSIKIRRPDQIIDDLLSILSLYPWERCGIDTSGNQEHFLDRVKDAVQRHNQNSQDKIFVPLVSLKDSVNKRVRIETALQPLVAGGLIKIRQDSKTLLEQLEAFPYGLLDGPDALEYAVRLVRSTVSVYEIRAAGNQEGTKDRLPGKTAQQIRRTRLRRLGINADTHPYM